MTDDFADGLRGGSMGAHGDSDGHRHGHGHGHGDGDGDAPDGHLGSHGHGHSGSHGHRDSDSHRDSDGNGHRALAHDRYWGAALREGAVCSVALLGLLLLVDLAAGDLSAARAALWAGLALLLFLVLLPPRVTAGTGWLAARGGLRERRVRTDCLVSLRWLDGVSRRLVLRDLYGTRIELDPRVLTSNPDLWHLLEQGARCSAERGLLTCGATALRQLSRRIDSETAHLLFRISGLK
ncbi:hypothetical protein ACFQVC_04870 [Streptomyces monticola]|uniref:PH domain-containing protein n=1 Tax=Streptomyces monticola TaxID=2666263 RepID=A0ABW2JD43_9ACTN